MQKQRIEYLFERYMADGLTGDERKEFFAVIRENGGEVQDLLAEMMKKETSGTYDSARIDAMVNSILSADKVQEARVIPMRKAWIKWVAAACIIALVGVAAYVILSTGDKPATVGHEGRLAHDVAAPSNTRAVITLADGSKVYLDSAGNGTIAQENHVNVIKNANGDVVYAPSVTLSGVEGLTYNTLANPRGSKVISLTLSDGTRVWLNSESSLKYPAAFTANTREVEITGEAYFEVKHNANQPFKAHLPNGSIVEDIGTAFNVNAYPDEDALKTTLVEGAIKVSANSASLLSAVKLRPGQQAVLNQANPKISRIEVQTNVDTDEVTAWKNGVFQFENGDIQSIMREVARWYDVNVVYEAKPEGHYRGKIARNVNLSQMLKILEEGGIQFKIEGKTIIVMK